MIFDYARQAVFTQSIAIDDPGNTGIRAETIEGFSYYMLIKTVMGRTSIFKYGPILDGVDLLAGGFDASFQQFNYKEATISKVISQFINDPRKQIANVEEVLQTDVVTAFPNVAVCLQNLE